MVSVLKTKDLALKTGIVFGLWQSSAACVPPEAETSGRREIRVIWRACTPLEHECDAPSALNVEGRPVCV